MKLKKLTRLATAAALATTAASAVGLALTASPSFAANGSVTYPTGTATTADSQIVVVTAPAGTFTAGQHVQVEECEGTTSAAPPSNVACDGGTLNSSGVAAADGSVTVNFRTFVLGVPGFVFGAHTHHVDASGSHPGVLYIGLNQNDFTQTHVFADLVIGHFGNTFAQAQSAGPAYPGGATVSLNAANSPNGPDNTDSAGQAQTVTYGITTAATQGTANCTSAGACTYGANSTASGASDTFQVTVTATGAGFGTTVGSPVTETVTLGHGNNPTATPTPNPLTLSSSAPTTTGTFVPNGAGTDSGGNAETITGASSTNGTMGTVSCASATPFTCTYTYNGGAPAGGGTDTVQVTVTAVVAGTTSPVFTSAQAPETINIPAQYTPNCDVTSG
ncbi:MAG: hypothetical protein ACYDD7_20995, partial [Acidimicrobiales bacterium]